MKRSLFIFFAGAAVATVVSLLVDTMSTVPASEYASQQATEAVKRLKRQLAPHMLTMLTGDIDEQRAVLDKHFFAPRIATARELYPVDEQVLEIDGVYTELFTPLDGVSEQNAHRVLINLHGGAFSMGARTEGRLESIPVASTAKIKVISVDYRQGPEHRFPAASEDVATVYRHLLKEYRPAEIGVFGCSAGGILAAQSVAWFQQHDLPAPGAIGIFCAGAGKIGSGDSAIIADALGAAISGPLDIEYFETADWSDATVAQLGHPEVLARFPPTLIITSTRDLALSAALVTHQQLLATGVHAELHVFEGLEHFFFADTELPESKRAFEIMARFFNRQLAPWAAQ